MCILSPYVSLSLVLSLDPHTSLLRDMFFTSFFMIGTASGKVKDVVLPHILFFV
jgi:hypothetical protein